MLLLSLLDSNVNDNNIKSEIYKRNVMEIYIEHKIP